MEIRPILSAMRRNRSGPLLVALQVALSLAILANALHIVVQRQALSARPTGLAAEEQVFALQVRHLRPASHERQLALQRAETAVLGAVPGVLAVAKVSQMPLSRIGIASSITITAAAGQSGTRHFAAVYRSPDALVATWGLRLSAGRDLVAADVRESDQNTSTRLPEVA
ncbi:MAG: ABC transporter permease, partial [Ideonella sp.]